VTCLELLANFKNFIFQPSSKLDEVETLVSVLFLFFFFFPSLLKGAYVHQTKFTNSVYFCRLVGHVNLLIGLMILQYSSMVKEFCNG